MDARQSHDPRPGVPVSLEELAEQSVTALENVLRGFQAPMSPKMLHQLQVHMLADDIRPLAERVKQLEAALRTIVRRRTTTQGDCRDSKERHFRHCPAIDYSPEGPCDCGGPEAWEALAPSQSGGVK